MRPARDREREDAGGVRGEAVARAAAPAPTPASAVLALQQAAGNRATGRFLARQATPYAELKSMYDAAVAEARWADAAKYLNGFSAEHIDEILRSADPATIVRIWMASDPYPTLRPRLAAEADRRAFERKDAEYRAAVAKGDFEAAALLLNGMSHAHIRSRLQALDKAQVQSILDACGRAMKGWPEHVQPVAREVIAEKEKPAAGAGGAEAKPGEVPLPAVKAADPKDFKTHVYEMSERNVTLVGEVKEKGKVVKAKIEETPAHYTAEILKAAGEDAKAWYSNFTSITFLGQPVGDIHIELAAHLKTVEKQFAEAYGGPDKDPKKAGAELGINEAMAGGRKHPTSAGISMHLFGLAIDVNYTANPFIGQSTRRNKDKSVTILDNEVFERAGLLVRGEKAAYKAGMKYAELSALDKVTEDYFACLKDDAKLKAALAGNAHAPWSGLDLAAARKIIEDDFKAVTKRWERTGAKQADTIETGGIMDLDERFVKGIGLSWGASYGDIMHFDMRNKGVGARIQKEIGAYKQLKQQEAADKAAEAAPAGG